ncbi:hypothetical protein OIU78_017890 [Salix suchowensis]|nr:hypothetical protein OIU78_017890 [Salix suchowensis]
MRMRRAAHLVDSAYVAKYAKAIAMMKSLPDDDPRSFKNQANVHCAYCDDSIYTSMKESWTKLRYGFQDVPIPWLITKPTPKLTRKEKTHRAAQTNTVLTPISAFPVVLDRVISVEVSRPRKSRSATEKEDEDEVLVIEGIEYKENQFIKFDVLLNDEPDSPGGPDTSEFAGSFVNLPHKHAKKIKDNSGTGDYKIAGRFRSRR